MFMTDIMMQAYQVLDEIKLDPVYQEIKRLDKIIVELYAKEIELFQQTKAIYDQVMKDGGTYHPDFKDVVKKYGEAKMDLYSKPELKLYFDYEKQFQDDLNVFLSDLSKTASDHIKTPNKLGIVKKGGSCHVG